MKSTHWMVAAFVTTASLILLASFQDERTMPKTLAISASASQALTGGVEEEPETRPDMESQSLSDPTPKTRDRALSQFKTWIAKRRSTKVRDSDFFTVTKHDNGWRTILHQSYEDRNDWAIMTLSPGGQATFLKGDRCLWGVQEQRPVKMLSLSTESFPVLALIEKDGGTGGFEETLRAFRLKDGEWQDCGSLPLSHVWRTDLFPELCGAETPSRRREVKVSTKDGVIVIEGHQETIERMPGHKANSASKMIRRTYKVKETFKVENGQCTKRAQDRKLMSEEVTLISLRTGIESIESYSRF